MQTLNININPLASDFLFMRTINNNKNTNFSFSLTVRETSNQRLGTHNKSTLSK